MSETRRRHALDAISAGLNALPQADDYIVVLLLDDVDGGAEGEKRMHVIHASTLGAAEAARLLETAARRLDGTG